MMHRLARHTRLAFAAIALTALAGCAETLSTNVTRFATQLPAPAGQSFAVLPEDPANSGGIEFGQYAADVAAHLVKLGYTQAPSADGASLVVHLGYGVDKGRQEISDDAYWGPWRGYRGGWGYGGGFGYGGRWGYGFYDPWFADSGTVYTSDISLKIDAKGDGHADGRRLFEGRAEAVSPSNHLTWLVPNLIDAMFTGFPGNSGQTVRITVAPEKR